MVFCSALPVSQLAHALLVILLVFLLLLCSVSLCIFQGFLPEGKFTRILTEPVCRDPGPRKRGRRPRGDMSKAGILLSDSHSGMGPLFMNGLIGNMDLMSLQNLRNVPGIPLSGLMGFPPGFTAVPAGEDTKNGLSVLPMMLHGMAAVQPHVFGVGGLMGQSAATGTPAPSAAGTASAAASPASTSDLAAPCPTGVESEPPGTQGGPEDGKQEKPPVEGKAGAACGHREPPASPVSGSGSHLTFNPFLIPGMSHGLLYPHMFLPHGGIMALQGVACADGAGSPKRKKKKVREEVAEDAAGKGSPQTDGVALRGPAQSQTEGGGVMVEPPGQVQRREADELRLHAEQGPRTPPGEGVRLGTRETDTVAEDMEEAETRGQGAEPDEEGPGGGGKSPLPSF